MRSSLTVGSVGGIPLKIHWNWALTAVLVTWSLASGYFPQEYPGWSVFAYWATGTITALFFFGSVLLHELGHAGIAIREHVVVQSITLFIFGGVAHIANEPETPGAEFRIVVAGPFTSLILAALFHVLSVATPAYAPISGGAQYLSRINVILAVFNLIPGFPLDGGRILRAAIWKVLRDFTRATRWATNAGFGIAFLFVAAGATFMWLGNVIGGLWIAFIGGYLGLVARGARLQIDADDQDQKVIEDALASNAFARPPLLGRNAPTLSPVRVIADLPVQKPVEAPFVVVAPQHTLSQEKADNALRSE
ncbi:MAG: site-2 protease family protein [Omnitrophica WOR_2 bacterium]